MTRLHSIERFWPGRSAWFERLLSDESGQDLIEYALLAALVGLGAITAVRGLGTKISAAFTSIGTTFTSDV